MFTYRDIPNLAYPEEIILKTERDYSYQIATPEKALCDKLYTLSPISNYQSLENMLFNDLRIDEDEFKKLNYSKIEKLSNLYHSTNVNLLAKYMRRNCIKNIKIKLEIDINPPLGATYEMQFKLLPSPHQIKLYDKELLFAGKIHAILCRGWKTRTKGRY